MKGVSPFIATVLLIAFTIAVGGILSLWLTGYTRTVTEVVGVGTEKQIKCTASVLSIKKVDNSTTSAKVLVYYISGSENLTSPRCEAIKGAVVNSTATFSLSPPYAPGATFICDINITGTEGLIDRVRVSTLCLDEVSISVDCRPDQPCWG